MTDRQWCPEENEIGRRCQFGPGHTTPCHFKAYVPSEAQWKILENVASVSGVRQFQNVGTSTTSTLKALGQRGFLKVQHVASRAWDVTLTPAGRYLLEMRPR